MSTLNISNDEKKNKIIIHISHTHFKTPCANINIIVIIKLQDDGKKKNL